MLAVAHLAPTLLVESQANGALRLTKPPLLRPSVARFALPFPVTIQATLLFIILPEVARAGMLCTGSTALLLPPEGGVRVVILL